MHSPTIFILSVVFGLLTCSCAGVRTQADPEKPSQVVQRYVSFALAGDFDKIETVTTLRAAEDLQRESEALIAEIRKERANSGKVDSLMVIPDPEVGARATLKWVRDEFAKSIHDQKQSIISVRKEASNWTEARVELLLGNENRVNLLPWVFILRKVEDKWKIYDITTAGADLPPLK